ncbi:MAG: GNAT family N-acetyltransferase [Pseudobdellovibrionaceae bacterium]
MQNSSIKNYALNIRRALGHEHTEISDLVMRSKSFWPYPPDYLSKCIDALRIDEPYIIKWPVYIGEVDGAKAGIFALKIIGTENRLDHLWVDPPFIGKGIGKNIFLRAIVEAKKMGWNGFRLAADPYALEFYLRLGGNQIGTVQSRIKPDLFLPHIEFSF